MDRTLKQIQTTRYDAFQIARLVATRKSTYQLTLVAIAILFLIVSLAGHAQQMSNTGTNADSNNPLGPTGPNKSTDIWNIDPKTGSVSMHIPIGTVPQGGRGPRVQPVFQYNSSSTIALSAPEAVTINADSQGNPIVGFRFFWIPPRYGLTYETGNGPVGPWTFTSGPSFFYGMTPTYDPVNPDGDGVNSGTAAPTQCRTIAPVLYADDAGQIHDLGLTVTYMFDFESSPLCGGNNTPSASTLDGSNISSSISGFIPPSAPGGILQEPTSPGNLNPILLPDGSQIKPVTSDLTQFRSNASIEDANGNIFSATGVDSQGRAIAASNIGFGSNDLSSVGTYTVTTVGASNNPENYSIAVSTPSFGNFTMPHPTASEVSVSATGNSGQTDVGLTCPRSLIHS